MMIRNGLRNTTKGSRCKFDWESAGFVGQTCLIHWSPTSILQYTVSQHVSTFTGLMESMSQGSELVLVEQQGIYTILWLAYISHQGLGFTCVHIFKRRDTLLLRISSMSVLTPVGNHRHKAQTPKEIIKLNLCSISTAALSLQICSPFEKYM